MAYDDKGEFYCVCCNVWKRHIMWWKIGFVIALVGGLLGGISLGDWAAHDYHGIEHPER